MTPGAIDLKIVDDRLAIVAACLADLRTLPAGSLADFAGDRRNPPAAESLLRRAIEALFDVARHLLAKSLGLGALEYREVAALAGQHGLVEGPSSAHASPRSPGSGPGSRTSTPALRPRSFTA